MLLYDISGLTRTYDGRRVLDISSLKIERGKIHALLGPNGAGKTTLLDILGFLKPPDTGSIIYNSRPVHFSASGLRSLRKHIVLIDQRPILFSSSVFKNVEFGLRIRHFSNRDRRKMVETVLDRVGMRHFMYTRATTLSGGETQRVAIARALALNPDVLLCDEPTANVDSENRAIIMNILQQINEQQNITIIFTSHDWYQVASLAHNSMHLNHGMLTDSAMENVFRVSLYKENEEVTRIAIQDRISLIVISSLTGDKTILIHPEKIEWIDPKKKAGKVNYFKGKVKQVAEDKGQIRIVVDIGIWITIRTSRAAYKKNVPMVGEPVSVHIPSGAIQIV